MRLAGPPKTRTLDVGLVVTPYHVLTAWGVMGLDEVPKAMRLYAYDSTGLMDSARQLCGTVLYWNGRIVGYVIGRHRIRVLGDVFDTDPRGAFESLDEWAAWLYSLGSAPGSFAGASIGIYKACADRETFFGSEKHATIPREALLIGSRQEASPGIYKGFDAWDVPAAYPTTLGGLWVPRRYRAYKKVAPRLSLVGFAHAVVKLPQLEYGPLPVAMSRYVGVHFPTACAIEGVWDMRELTLAEEMGCGVRVLQGWVGVGLAPSFHRWHDAVMTGRELRSPDARALAKATGVSLWGFFAAQGHMTKMTWLPDGTETMEYTKDRLPLALPIAAHVAAAMRARLYREALVRSPIVAHTDGAIMAGAPLGDGWRHEGRLKTVEVLTAQNYRYVTEDGEVGYCLAGVPRHNAAKVWTERRRELYAQLGILRKDKAGMGDLSELRAASDLPPGYDEQVAPAVARRRKAEKAARPTQASLTL